MAVGLRARSRPFEDSVFAPFAARHLNYALILEIAFHPLSLIMALHTGSERGENGMEVEKRKSYIRNSLCKGIKRCPLFPLTIVYFQ